MKSCFKAFFFGLSTGTVVAILFDLSQLRYSQMAFKEGVRVGYSRAHRNTLEW